MKLCDYAESRKLPQDRSEQEQRKLARLKRFQASGSDAPAPVQMYER